MPRDHQAELETADRHIREAEAHISRQQRILSELRRDGHPTGLAVELLAQFEQTLESHRQHKALIEKEIALGE